MTLPDSSSSKIYLAIPAFDENSFGNSSLILFETIPFDDSYTQSDFLENSRFILLYIKIYIKTAEALNFCLC